MKKKISKHCKELFCDTLINKKEDIMKQTLEDLRKTVEEFQEKVKKKQVA